GLDLDLAAQLADARLDHVHAHAAAGDVGDLGLGREARQEHQLQALVRAQARRGLRIDQALLARLGAQALRIDAGAVVLHLDGYVVAFLLRRQAQPADARLAGRLAQLRRLDAVV